LLFYTHSSERCDEVTAHFHCPACGDRDVRGLAWTERQSTRLLGILPILEERLHWVSAPCCERQLMSRVTPRALAELDPDEIQFGRILRDRVSPVKILLLISAYLFCFMPVLGPVFFLFAWLPSGSSRTWFRMACRIWVILHLVMMNALVVLLIMADKK